MGQDSYLPLEKSGQSVIDQNLPYRFLRGQPLNTCFTMNCSLFGQLDIKTLDDADNHSYQNGKG